MDTLLISEFARHSGVSVHTLRHWHEVGLLTPAEVDLVSGYRRYHADQLGPARLISSLRQADVSVLLIRQILQAAHRDELKDAFQLLVHQARTRVQRQTAMIQAFTMLLEHLDQVPAPLPSRWMAELPPLPVSRLSVAFVGISGGIGRTPSAISTAAMLSRVVASIARKPPLRSHG
ncbi:MerR family transcriptional regulator [Deinococcus aquaticus]|uniref:MerR family transcriptional regulator n=1 Tax=Deinococcus aquaticus TaxID=328692 RepID=UPI003F48BB78